MLIGVAIGDALGAPHEFRYMKNVYTGYLQYPVQLQFRFGQKYKYPIASYTDDTESTITLARSLVRNKGYDEKDAIMSYLRWVNSDTRFLGTNTHPYSRISRQFEDIRHDGRRTLVDHQMNGVNPMAP